MHGVVRWVLTLIFNTHEISLLDLNLFRRDQIYFVEKIIKLAFLIYIHWMNSHLENQKTFKKGIYREGMVICQL